MSLRVLERYARLFHAKNPDKKLVIWAASHYDTISPLANEKNIHGYSETFLHHRGRNPHHYEYWVHSLDEGGVPAKMPRKYALELVCDYLAAGRTYNKDFTYGSEYNWWIKFLSSPRAIHPETKDFVTKCFRHLSAGGNIKYLLKIDYE